MIRLFKRLMSWTQRAPEFPSYGVRLYGPMPTWSQASLEVTSLTFESVDEDVEDEEWSLHNPMELGFPSITARLRLPDQGLNDLLVYSESSRSYAVIKRVEHPQETAGLVEKLRAGFTYDEATRAN